MMSRALYSILVALCMPVEFNTAYAEHQVDMPRNLTKKNATLYKPQPQVVPNIDQSCKNQACSSKCACPPPEKKVPNPPR